MGAHLSTKIPNLFDLVKPIKSIAISILRSLESLAISLSVFELVSINLSKVEAILSVISSFFSGPKEKAINSNLEVLDEQILKLTGYCKQSPEGQFINGKRDGEWIWWDKYNRKIKAGNYVNGSKEGPWFEWLYTGRAYDTIEMNYKNDMLDGKWTYWYSYEGPFKALYGDDEKHLVEAMIAFLKNEHAEILVESQLSDEPKKYESKLSELEEHIQYQERQLTKFEVPRIIEEGN